MEACQCYIKVWYGRATGGAKGIITTATATATTTTTTTTTAAAAAATTTTIHASNHQTETHVYRRNTEYL